MSLQMTPASAIASSTTLCWTSFPCHSSPCLPLAQMCSVLHLYDNPLDFLPEISPCSELTHLTVANLRITADQVQSKGGSHRGHMCLCGGAWLAALRRHTCTAMLALTMSPLHDSPFLLLQAYTKVGSRGLPAAMVAV